MSVYIWRMGLGFVHMVVSLAYNPNGHTVSGHKSKRKTLKPRFYAFSTN
jgi:hypothetical protein